MSDIAIKVEDVGKLYRLGEVGTGTLSQDLKRWWAVSRGKEDPFAIIGETNDRTTEGDSEFVWALKNVSFDVMQGEVLGMIGRNGAGKSTLLKLLSKVTTPSTGNIKIKGRIASLLEVGTGFHPDLTGRENVFLNGAILGMTKHEIQRKFDEIIDFAGVERYVDTPVKRYSSGMYVRLAFAVAAHLDPEILIIDEVLAVGDAEFQKKCIGKMKDASEKEGRTVLFVSHDMAAITALTTHCLCLKHGSIALNGKTDEVIKYYLESEKAGKGIFEKTASLHKPSIVRVEVITSETEGVHKCGEPLEVFVDINLPEEIRGIEVTIQICDNKENPITFSPLSGNSNNSVIIQKGVNRLRCVYPNLRIYQGSYHVFVHLAETKGRTYFDGVNKICEFEVQMIGKTTEWGWRKGICQYLEDYQWNVIKIGNARREYQ
jgi:lipopolysaccharide transport system ATP-binding protein